MGESHMSSIKRHTQKVHTARLHVAKVHNQVKLFDEAGRQESSSAEVEVVTGSVKGLLQS